MMETGNIKLLGVPSDFRLSQKGVSCTNAFLCRHLMERGVVSALVNTELSRIRNIIFMIESFSLNKEAWLFRNRILHKKAVFRSKSIRNIINKMDLAQVNASLQIGSEFSLENIEKLKNIPKFSYHDNNILAYLKTYHELPSKILRKDIAKIINFEKRVYEGLDGIFTMSDYLRNVFVNDFKVPEEKVHTIGVGCNIEIEDVYDKDYDQNNILFVAKDSFKEKGGHDLIKAFKRVKKIIKNAKLYIVGQKVDIKDDDIINIGFIDKNSLEGEQLLKSYYMNSSIFVMPSYVEAMGNVFLEAMSFKLPCIGADTSAMPEIICNNECGFVIRPGDIKDLANKIIMLLEDKKLLKKCGENGYSAIKNKYNWSTVCEKAMQIIKNKI